jgi:hypothetical protein
MPVLSKEHETLPCDLTSEELEQKGQDLATICEEISQVEAEKSDTAKQFKERLERLEAKKSVLARQVKTRSEEREVEVHALLLVDDRTVRTVRTDTGETVRQRPASERELTAGHTLFDQGSR